MTEVVQALAALLLAVIAGVTPFIVPLLRAYLQAKLQAAQAKVVQDAADVGAKAAYGEIAVSGGSYRNEVDRNHAITTGVLHVQASAPDALAALEIKEPQVRRMVEARLGGELAADPTVSIKEAPFRPPSPLHPVRTFTAKAEDDLASDARDSLSR